MREDSQCKGTEAEESMAHSRNWWQKHSEWENSSKRGVKKAGRGRVNHGLYPKLSGKSWKAKF